MKKLTMMFALLAAATVGLSSENKDATIAKALEESQSLQVAFDKPTITYVRPYQETRYHFELAGQLIWATTITDIVSTELATSRPGVTEGNPLVRNRAFRIGYKVGTAYLANDITKRIAPKYPKLVPVIRWSVVAVMSFATGNNVVLYSF